MKRLPIFASPLLRFFAAALAITLAGCSSYAQMQTHDELHKSVKAFNMRFEGKMMGMSSPFVILEKQEEFLKKSLRVENDVVFYNTSVLNVRLFDDDKPIRLTDEGPADEFNKAHVLIRYQVTVMPSNKLKTLMVNQKWVYNENVGWQVDPDLDVFFEPAKSR